MNRGLHNPPEAIRKVKLDNLALLPGSELGWISRYRAIANKLPDGGVLIVLPNRGAKQKRAVFSVAKVLAEHGRKVRIISRHLKPQTSKPE